MVSVSNSEGFAKIALHGAHVVEFSPAGQAPVIYTSRSAVYREGKAIRGGIPVCWPWFGGHPTDASKPAHGFARNRFWRLMTIESTDDNTALVFELPVVDGDNELYPYDVEVNLRVTVAESLKVELSTRNIGEKVAPVGGALHSYFSVSSIHDVKISGLDQVEFIDTVVNKTGKQDGDIMFSGELDRVYLNSHETAVVHDGSREVVIEKDGSQSTVVWNPWIQKSSGMGDLGNDDYLQFLCIEAANAMDDIVQLLPGQTHTLSTTISVR